MKLDLSKILPYLFSVLLFHISPQPKASAAHHPTDSLRQALADAKGLTRLKVLDELCFYYRRRNDDSVWHYATQGWSASENKDDEMSMLFADYLGGAHYRFARYDSAYWYLSRALALTQQLSDSAYMVTVANSLGTLHFTIGDLKKGTQYAITALQVAEAIGDSPRFIASCLMNVAAMQYKLKNHPQAKAYFLRALHLLQDERGIRARDNALHNLGVVYRDGFADFDSAAYYFHQALHLRKSDRPIELAMTYKSLGDLYYQQEQYSTAMSYYDSAIVTSTAVKAWLPTVSATLQKGKVQLAQQHLEEALAFATATRQGLDSVYTLEHLRNAEKLLADIYEALDQQNRALEHLHLHEKWKDSVLNVEKIRSLTNLEWQYKVSGRDQEIADLSASNLRWGKLAQRQGWILFGTAIMLAIVGCFLWRVQKRKRHSEALHQEQQTRAQIALDLKEQELSTLSLNLVTKQDLITKLKRNIANAESEQDMKKVVQQIQATDALDRDWDSFKLHFEKVHVGFFQRLKTLHPKVTPHEEKLCAYLSLNLSSKEVARLMHSSLAAVEKSRYRLRKKMGLEAGANLLDYIKGI